MQRVKLSDAMRSEGVDEMAVATTYKSLLEREGVKGSTQDAKLLLETARDCAKILEPSRESDEIPENAIVQLIHNVPRPDRGVAVEKSPPPERGSPFDDQQPK